MIHRDDVFGINSITTPRTQRGLFEIEMRYQRYVRSHYPAEIVRLAQALKFDCKPRDIALALSVPLSTSYRWFSEKSLSPDFFQRGWTKVGDSVVANRVDQLIAACENRGFDIRQNVWRLIPRVWKNSASVLVQAKSGPYDFLSSMSNQIVVGQLTFPRGPKHGVDANWNPLDFANGKLTASLRSQVLLAKMEIDQHYYTRLSCDALARIVGMTKYNFIRAFKAAFTMPPYQYLNKERVDHARHMLALSSQPLPVIAASVGFSSAGSLARAFKRFAGASPANVIHKVPIVVHAGVPFKA